MKIEFHPAKSARNAKERGLPFELAAQLDWSVAHTIEDQRQSYGDEGLSRREIAFYDSLAENESAVNIIGNNSLKVRPPMTALADWSKRLKSTIRPELETWPFFTHIEIGNYSLGGLSLVTSVGTTPPNWTCPIAVAEDG